MKIKGVLINVLLAVLAVVLAAENSSFKVDAVVKIVSNGEADTMCAAFVDELLK